MIGADIPADIESASQVVQRYGADSGHEDAFEHAFELLEDFTVKAASMGQRMIDFLALLIQHHIGEVIIFINQ